MEYIKTRRPANFDLRLSGVPGGQIMEIVDSPAGQTAQPVPVPCDLAVLPVDLDDTIASGQALGATLWRATVGLPPVAELWRASQAVLAGEGVLRLRLMIDDDPVAALPWELLFDETLGRFVALDATSTVVRFVRLPFAPLPWPQARPIRLLFTGAAPQDQPSLALVEEWEGIQRGLLQVAQAGRLVLTGLTFDVTLGALVAQLRRGVDVWHFAGHGHQTGLVFVDDRGASAWVDAQTLGMLLTGEGVRLAVLNACQAGAGGGSNATVAGALVRAGLPAVVAMQAELYDVAAQAFAAAFYDAVSLGVGVDQAVTAGRKAVLAMGGEVAASWWLPALLMRTPDGMVWQGSPVDTARHGGGDTIRAGGPVATHQSALAVDGIAVSGTVRGNVIFGKQAR